MLDDQGLIFSPFDLNDKYDNPLHDVDPGIQFYNKHYTGSLQSCDYYLEEMFNDKIKKYKISNQSSSSLHINIRSAQKKLGSLENYLDTLDHKFTTIGISESWLKDANTERYVSKGYNAVHKCRPLRSGGGVSIYIQDFLEYYTRKTCVTKIAQLNPFSLKSTRINWKGQKCHYWGCLSTTQ